MVRAAGEGKGVGVGGEGEESFARSAGSNLTTWVGGDPGERNEGVDTASSLDRPRGRVLCFAPEVAHGTNVPCPACVQVSVLWEPEEGVCAASECERRRRESPVRLALSHGCVICSYRRMSASEAEKEMAKSRNEAGRDMRRAGETTSKQASRRRESRSQERLKGGVGGGKVGYCRVAAGVESAGLAL